MSQASDILDYLKTHEEGITPIEALQLFGCMRLAARIADLKADGHRIARTDDIHEGGRHARYRLVIAEERRTVATLDDWASYRRSAHALYGHRRHESWCLWCRRIADEDARCETSGVMVTPDESRPATEPMTLWDAR